MSRRIGVTRIGVQTVQREPRISHPASCSGTPEATNTVSRHAAADHGACTRTRRAAERDAMGKPYCPSSGAAMNQGAGPGVNPVPPRIGRVRY
ncbi:hypothetical protein GCM10010177_26830 [Actinomadura citrea]|nr:hypothetical protein GCM10010177_26830 [Actinomadura citrea]